jgi:hypothetical protein
MNAHAGGLDPEKEGFAETVTEVAAVATDLITLSKTMTGPGQDAANISYLLMKAGGHWRACVDLFDRAAAAVCRRHPESIQSLDPALCTPRAGRDRCRSAAGSGGQPGRRRRRSARPPAHDTPSARTR